MRIMQPPFHGDERIRIEPKHNSCLTYIEQYKKTGKTSFKGKYFATTLVFMQKVKIA